MPLRPATTDCVGPRLAEPLARLADRTAIEGPWRSGAFALLAREGMLAAFIDPAHGGTGLAEPAIISALVAIAERCLTTALALTQWASAVRIIAGGDSAVRAALLPGLARGESFTTVGISHLTTSRRHLGRPAVVATHAPDGWRLDGVCPWVTGADSTGTLVTGAETDVGGTSFFVVDTDAAGLAIEPPLAMLSLTGSRTSVVRLEGVRPTHVLPVPATGGARTGGLATTALAVGAARASVAVLVREAEVRASLDRVASEFAGDLEALSARLASAALGSVEPIVRDRLRADATGFVVRAAQAALTASKGAGFVVGHPVERLVRESLFFLVWSCPPAVADAVLCDLAAR